MEIHLQDLRQLNFMYCRFKNYFTFIKKLIRFHQQAFIVYKTGENLLAFLHHMKPKIFFNG